MVAFVLTSNQAEAIVTEWEGDVDSSWSNDENWVDGTPGVNDSASFRSDFTGAFQPVIDSAGATSVREIRVLNPPQAITITANDQRLQITSISSTGSSNANVAILMSNNSAKDLTITGTAEFRQRGNGSATPEYKVTGGGNLTISTGTFRIIDAGAGTVTTLTVNVGTGRTVDFQTAITNGSGGATGAGIRKSGAGRLILGGGTSIPAQPR